MSRLGTPIRKNDNVIVITGLLLLLLWIPLRQRPGIGTILNAVEIGLVADQQRPAKTTHTGIECGLERDLRPDPGRISCCNGDARQGHGD